MVSNHSFHVADPSETHTNMIVNTPYASRRLSFRHYMMDRFTHGLHTSSLDLVARIRPDR